MCVMSARVTILLKRPSLLYASFGHGEIPEILLVRLCVWVAMYLLLQAPDGVIRHDLSVPLPAGGFGYFAHTVGSDTRADVSCSVFGVGGAGRAMMYETKHNLQGKN